MISMENSVAFFLQHQKDMVASGQWIWFELFLVGKGRKRHQQPKLEKDRLMPSLRGNRGDLNELSLSQHVGCPRDVLMDFCLPQPEEEEGLVILVWLEHQNNCGLCFRNLCKCHVRNEFYCTWSLKNSFKYLGFSWIFWAIHTDNQQKSHRAQKNFGGCRVPKILFWMASLWCHALFLSWRAIRYI